MRARSRDALRSGVGRRDEPGLRTRPAVRMLRCSPLRYLETLVLAVSRRECDRRTDRYGGGMQMACSRECAVTLLSCATLFLRGVRHHDRAAAGVDHRGRLAVPVLIPTADWARAR
jgi:hypothetical protein